MFKVVKKIIKYFFILMLVLIIALVSVPFLFKDKIKALVLEKIDKNINAKVYFNDISVSSFKEFPHVTLTLHKVCVNGIDDFAGDTLASAKEISLSFNLKTILKGQDLEIIGVHLEDPLIYARILPNGEANYNIVKPDTSKSKASQNNLEINIDRWSINNGRIIYDDKLQKTFIEIGGLFHNGSGDFKQEVSDLDISTKVSDLTLVYNGIKFFNRKLFEADLMMEMNFKEKKFVFKDHTFKLGDFKFAFKGFFKLLENGYQTDLKFIVRETSFKNLLSLLPGIYQKDMEGIKTSGEFSCRGFLKGIYDVKDNKVPAFNLELKVHDAMFKYSHLPKAVEKISFDFVADNPDGNAEHSVYDLKVFHFEFDKSPVHGKIYVKGNKNMHINANIKLKADLAEIEKIYPVNGLTLKGIFNSEIKIDGKYNSALKLLPKIDAFVTLDKGYIKWKDMPLDMDSIHVNAEILNTTGQLVDTRVKINNINFLLDDEPFVMSGTIEDLKDYDYDLKIDGLVDLEKLTKLYPIANTELKGTVNFDITTDGNLTELEAKKYDLLKTEGTLELKNVSYTSKSIPDPLHIDDALFTFTPDKIVLDRFKGEFGKSNITLSGHLFNYIPFLLRPDAPIKGDLRMDCDTLDLNALFPASLSDNADSAKANTKAAPAEVVIIPKNIGFTIDSDIKLIKFGQMDIVNLDGEIKIQNGILTLNETKFTSMESNFKLSGDYNTQDNKHPMFDLDIDIDNLDISKAYTLFVDDKEPSVATGSFSTNYSLKGELTPDFSPINSTLAGSGKIIIDNVSVKEMKMFNHIKSVSKKEEFNNPQLNDLILDTEIKKGKFMIYPFSFKVNKFLTEVEGEQSIVNDNINYSIKISIPPFKKLRIPISIIGSTDKPVIKMGKGFDPTDFDKME